MRHMRKDTTVALNAITNFDPVVGPIICPTCKFELTNPTTHGWLKGDFGVHTGWKTQLIPCPDCSDQANARRKSVEIARLMGQAHIPPRYQDWSFASTPTDVDTSERNGPSSLPIDAPRKRR